MKIQKVIGIFLSLALVCGTIQNAEDPPQTHTAAAETITAETAFPFPETAATADEFESTTAGLFSEAENAGESDNPFDKQDDREVPYDASRWVQPKEWNTPAINPRDYQDGIMLFFDKIGLEQEYARGKTQRVYFSIVGATEPVSYVKFHIYYDTRLKVKPNSAGDVLNNGKAFTDFTTGSAMIKEGQLVFYAYSEEAKLLNNSSLFTIDFIVPENAEKGDVYPIGLAYTDDGIVKDTFIKAEPDGAGMLQMTYVFTRGIYNGYIRILGEKPVTSAASTTVNTEEPLRGDVDCSGDISTADAVLLSRITAEDICDEIALTEQNFIAADFDNDGQITIQDTAKLLDFLLEASAS